MERLTEISGIGDKTASQIIDVLLAEGLDNITRSSLTEINGVGDSLTLSSRLG